MRNGKVLAVGIAIAAAGLLVAVAPFASALRHPPVLHVVRLESAAVVDDAGVELVFLTLSISNAQAQLLFVRDAGVPLQARIAGHWSEVRWSQSEVKVANCALSPLRTENVRLLVPASAEACRVAFEYTGAVTRIKWRLAQLAERLPTYIRFHIPRFWYWIGGYERYKPSSNWKGCTVDLQLPTGPSYGAGA